MNPWLVDTFAEHERRMERIDREVAEGVRRRKEAAAKAANERELADVVASVARGEAAGYQRHVERIAREHNIRVFRGSSPQANKTARVVTLPEIRTAPHYAGALHECGHVIAEPCPGGLHDPQYVENFRYANCARCEVLAWQIALEYLAVVPFTRPMFDHLSYCLRTYRHTPAPAAALRQLNAVVGSVQFAEHRQRHITRAWREERQAAAMRDLERDRQKSRDEEVARIREFSDRILQRRSH